MTWTKTTGNGVQISIHLSPRAKTDRIDGFHGDALKVRIKAPPVDGKANAYLCAFIAQTLGIAASRVSLVRGETSRSKTLLITGLPEQTVRDKCIAGDS